MNVNESAMNLAKTIYKEYQLSQRFADFKESPHDNVRAELVADMFHYLKDQTEQASITEFVNNATQSEIVDRLEYFELLTRYIAMDFFLIDRYGQPIEITGAHHTVMEEQDIMILEALETLIMSK